MIKRYNIPHEQYDVVLDEYGIFVLWLDHEKELEAVKNRVCCCNNRIIERNVNGNVINNKYCCNCGGKIEIKREVK